MSIELIVSQPFESTIFTVYVPANKLSIETREEIVMPLITIQQYALQIVNEIDSNKLDNSKKLS